MNLNGSLIQELEEDFSNTHTVQYVVFNLFSHFQKSPPGSFFHFSFSFLILAHFLKHKDKVFFLVILSLHFFSVAIFLIREQETGWSEADLQWHLWRTLLVV